MMGSEELNVKVVEAVEKYECLYNSLSDDYSKKGKIDKAWAEVAKEVGKPESFCKEKWRNIRVGFSRSLKECTTSGSEARAKKRKYYLHHSLQFLLPHLKYNKPGGNISMHTSKEDENSSNIPKLSDTRQLEEISSSVAKATQSSFDEINASEGCLKRKVPTKDCHIWHIDKGKMDHFLNKNKDTKADLDKKEEAMLSFLKGLLPDLMDLSNQKQRQFKLKVMQIINELYEKDERENASSSTAFSRDAINVPTSQGSEELIAEQSNTGQNEEYIKNEYA